MAVVVPQRDALPRFAALGESDLEHRLPLRTDDPFHKFSPARTARQPARGSRDKSANCHRFFAGAQLHLAPGASTALRFSR